MCVWCVSGRGDGSTQHATFDRPPMTTQPLTRRESSKLLACVRTMPPSDHWPDRPLPFHPERSEVCDWLAAQPDVRQWLFRIVQDRRLIRFDPETKRWQGVPSVAPDEPEGTAECEDPPPVRSLLRTEVRTQGPAAQAVHMQPVLEIDA